MDDLNLAVDAARTGAAIVRSHFGRAGEAEFKRKFDPVTVADRESEEAIVGMLGDARPEYGILAEEGSGAAAAGRRWIVDPLDGTVNYVHGIPQIGVSIALYEDADPVLAVTIDVLRAEEFVAVAGRGATLNGAPISVSSVSDLGSSVVATGFPYDHDQKAAQLGATIEAVLRHVNGIRRMGAAVLDCAWVAAGRYDAYWEYDLAPWDLAAGILLVREAGGVVTHPDGGPASPEARSILAANPLVHADLQRTVAGSQR